MWSVLSFNNYISDLTYRQVCKRTFPMDIQRTILALVRLDQSFTPLLFLHNDYPNIRSI